MHKIFVLSFKGSKRLPKIKKRLKKIKLNFKVIYGVDVKNKRAIDILKKNYNKKKTEFFLGRSLPYSEMSAPYLHLKTYKHIVKHNIKKSIIFEDDVYPSKEIINFKKINFTKLKNYIIGFMSYDGFVLKKPDFKVDNFNFHKAKTHLHHVSAYACDLNFCKTILKKTDGKICGVSDWPINLIKNNIYSSIVLPYPVIINEKFESYLAKDRKLSLPKYKIKKYIPQTLFLFLSFFYYLLHIPFFTGRYKSIDFFREYFVQKKIYSLYSLFSNNYLSTKKIYFNKDFYRPDLNLILKKNINKKNII